MGFRVDSCMVTVELVIEFEGRSTISFSLPPDDPLVAQLLARNDQINLAAAKTGADISLS